MCVFVNDRGEREGKLVVISLEKDVGESQLLIGQIRALLGLSWPMGCMFDSPG